MKVKRNKQAKEEGLYLVSILGFKVGFNKAEWIEGVLILLYNDMAVASVEGEYLKEFRRLCIKLNPDLKYEWDL